MLDIKKVYIDTRYKTVDSNSDSDFFIELPLAVNIPDKCICYIDDIVLPVSWTMIDNRNNKLYLGFKIGTAIAEETVTIPSGNYNGITFGKASEITINTVLNPFSTRVDITYDNINNKISILMTDERETVEGELELIIIPDDEVASLFSIHPSEILSVNGVLMLKGASVIYPTIPKTFYLDMHTTRNLYLTSSSLGSFNTISNFGLDSIIKKIPVRYNYNEMLFDGSEAGYDFLDISRSTLKRIDFKLLDSAGRVVNLNGNHFSFSLVFQEQ
jgi:hypothetical protein